MTFEDLLGQCRRLCYAASSGVAVEGGCRPVLDDVYETEPVMAGKPGSSRPNRTE